MANVTIAGGSTNLPVANSIDGAADYLPIYTASSTATQAINRNTLLGLASAPVGLTDSQTLTNKILTSPTINGATLSGTLSGTYTLGGTPTFPSSVVTLTGSQTLTNKVLTSPTINSPTITNASITADSVSGFTTSNSGTIYGIAVTTGQITGASTVTNAALATGIQTSKFSNPYKFQVYLAGTASNPGNVWTQMKFDTKVFDTSSNYSTSTNLFTAPVNGFYQFNAAYGCSSTTDGQLVSIGINKNTFSTSPTYQGATFDNGGTSIVALTMSKLIQLTAGDTIGVYFYNNSGTQIAFTGTNPMYTYFEGYLVSAT